MAKRRFRPSSSVAPQYPRFAEVEEPRLASWGLATVGGVLVGLSACKQPTPPEPRDGFSARQRPAIVATTKPWDAGASDATTKAETRERGEATSPSPIKHDTRATRPPPRPERIDGGLSLGPLDKTGSR